MPLATGSAVHLGLAELMTKAIGGQVVVAGTDIEEAVRVAIQEFKDQCEGRGLDLGELESQSFVYNEQLALIEALVRLCSGSGFCQGYLEEYEVLEVERNGLSRSRR